MRAVATADPRLLTRDFDDLVEGLTFETRGRTITEADVVSFAALTGDFHPQHVDADWAASSIFGERVAHGMLLASYAVGLVNLEPERVVALRRITSATFKAPVRLGDTIRVLGRIVRLLPLDDEHGLVGSSWRIVNQDDRPVVLLGVEVVWRRSVPAGTDPDGGRDY